jgi:hypothetical protein
MPECSKGGVSSGAKAGLPTGSQAAVHTRLRLPGLRTAHLCRTSLTGSCPVIAINITNIINLTINITNTSTNIITVSIFSI